MRDAPGRESGGAYILIHVCAYKTCHHATCNATEEDQVVTHFCMAYKKRCHTICRASYCTTFRLQPFPGTLVSPKNEPKNEGTLVSPKNDPIHQIAMLAWLINVDKVVTTRTKRTLVVIEPGFEFICVTSHT